MISRKTDFLLQASLIFIHKMFHFRVTSRCILSQKSLNHHPSVSSENEKRRNCPKNYPYVFHSQCLITSVYHLINMFNTCVWQLIRTPQNCIRAIIKMKFGWKNCNMVCVHYVYLSIGRSRVMCQPQVISFIVSSKREWEGSILSYISLMATQEFKKGEGWSSMVI